MIDDFAQPAWAEAHEKLAADLERAFVRLCRWLGSLCAALGVRRSSSPASKTSYNDGTAGVEQGSRGEGR